LVKRKNSLKEKNSFLKRTKKKKKSINSTSTLNQENSESPFFMNPKKEVLNEEKNVKKKS